MLAMIIGILLILGIAVLMSNNKKKINLKTVFSGLGLQLLFALFVLKTELGKNIFHVIGQFIQKILDFSVAGGDFVFGVLTNSPSKISSGASRCAPPLCF